MEFLLKEDITEIVESLGDLAQEFSGKRILIAGGRGFLGRYFSEVFLELNERVLDDPCEVVVLDNFITAGEHGSVVPKHKHFAFVNHDIIKPFYPERKVDFILQAAGIASPFYYRKYPLETLEVATIGLKNMLEIAKNNNSKLLFFSSSEIYGDPDPKHVPTPESYNGYVSCIGDRSCYDESKRLGETLTKIYHNQFGVHANIARPFNCLTGDQKVLYKKDNDLFFESFEQCYSRTGGTAIGLSVPSFGNNGKIKMHNVTNVLRRHIEGHILTICTKWGRSISVTEDHELFKFENEKIQSTYAKDLNISDKIVIPSYLQIPETDLTPFFISDKISQDNLSIRSQFVNKIIQNKTTELRIASNNYGIENRMFSSYCMKWNKKDRLPISIFNSLSVPHDSEELICYHSSRKFVKNRIEDIDSLLWLFGYTIADCHILDSDNDHRLIYSDKHKKYLDKVCQIIKKLFGITSLINIDKTNTPVLNIGSKVIIELFKNFGIYGVGNDKIIPSWIMQLPKQKISQFLHGFWCGDGNHDAKTTGKFMIFNNSNLNIIHGINLLLMRLGRIGSMFSFKTRAAKHKEYVNAYRIELRGVDGIAVDKLHEFIPSQDSDITYAKIKSISKKNYNGYVYDFTVPETQNFLGGVGIMCHNCIGPGMQKTDYRVLPNFAVKILENKPVNIYGTGKQTRTFCYITDAINGFLRVLVNGSPGEPYNIGNPTPEISMLDLSSEIEIALGQPIKKNIIEYPDSYPSMEPSRRCPDITKARIQLGYEPKVSLQEGLSRFFKWAEVAYSESI